MAKTVPNSSVWDVPTVGVLVSGAGAGGEDVDVLLDALVRIVDRMLDEPPAVVGITAEPVAGEPVGQPHAPPDDEPLHQVDVEQVADDVRDGQADEDQDRRPKSRESQPSFAAPSPSNAACSAENWSLD